MTIVGPAKNGLSKKQIIAAFPTQIKDVLDASCDKQHDYERQILINEARRNWMYFRGNHYAIPETVASEWGEYTDFVPFDPNGGEGDDTNGADVRLCPPVNFIGGDGYKFCAVMGNTAPRVKAVSNNPRKQDDLDAAADADVSMRDSWHKQKVDQLWKLIPFHQYVTGPAFVRTKWNTDRKQYGETEEPIIEIRETQEGLPVPQKVGTRKYANGDAEPSVHSCIEVSVSFEATKLRDSAFLRYEVMLPKWSLLAKYKGTNAEPGPLEKYRKSDVPDEELSPADTTANEAQQAVANPSATASGVRKNYWRFSEQWVNAENYEAIEEPEIRTIFEEQFPDGLYVAKVGSIICEIDNRDKCREWSVAKVGRGDKILDRALCADAIPIQRALNDLIGMAIETVLRAITQTIVDAQLIDRQAMKKKTAIPDEFIFTAMSGFEGDIRNRVFQVPGTKLSDQVLPLINTLRAFSQDITGIRPELTGGGQPTQTYREAKQRKDQALLQLAPQVDQARFCAENLAENMTHMRAQYGAGTVEAVRPGSFGMEVDEADLTQLKTEGWHAEADDNFPMSLSDARDALFSMLTDFPPEVQTALSILDPLNIEQMFEYIQVPGFDSAVKDQKEKTMDDIRNLLANKPQPGDPGPDGKPGPMQPSMLPDEFDNHLIAANVVQKWLISKTGREQAKTNAGGYANVAAFHALQMKLAVPPPPPPPPPIKGSLALSAKLEDFPQLLQEALQGAGLPAPPPSAVDQASAPNPGGIGAPQPAAQEGANMPPGPPPSITGIPNGGMPTTVMPSLH